METCGISNADWFTGHSEQCCDLCMTQVTPNRSLNHCTVTVTQGQKINLDHVLSIDSLWCPTKRDRTPKFWSLSNLQKCSRSSKQPQLCNHHIHFERISFRAQAEVSAWLTGLKFSPCNPALIITSFLSPSSNYIKEKYVFFCTFVRVLIL